MHTIYVPCTGRQAHALVCAAKLSAFERACSRAGAAQKLSLLARSLAGLARTRRVHHKHDPRHSSCLLTVTKVATIVLAAQIPRLHAHSKGVRATQRARDSSSYCYGRRRPEHEPRAVQQASPPADVTHVQLNALVGDAANFPVVRLHHVSDRKVLEQRALARAREAEDEVLAFRAHRAAAVVERGFGRVPIRVVAQPSAARVEVLVLRTRAAEGGRAPAIGSVPRRAAHAAAGFRTRRLARERTDVTAWRRTRVTRPSPSMSCASKNGLAQMESSSVIEPLPSLSRLPKTSSQAPRLSGGISAMSRIFVSESGGLEVEAPQPIERCCCCAGWDRCCGGGGGGGARQPCAQQPLILAAPRRLAAGWAPQPSCGRAPKTGRRVRLRGQR